ncbi:MAG TPA: hypothetical protein VGS58_05975, partial [Candidatus Sulfopaludibacter sp.]|nr:hypothetical protein [Candidatus Sulfopaludibacter sp.]
KPPVAGHGGSNLVRHPNRQETRAGHVLPGGRGPLPGMTHGGAGTFPVVQRMEDLHPTVAPTQPNAGTKPLAFTVDGRYVVKIGSEREEFTYQVFGSSLGQGNVLVESVPHKVVKQGEQIVAVVIADEEIALQNPIPVPKNGQRVVVTKKLGGPPSGDQTFTMDIKIGFYTKSEEQYALEGHNWFEYTAKQVEHDLKDAEWLPRMGPVGHGSFARGFDVDPKGAANFRGYRGHSNFNKCLKHILNDIDVIINSLGDSPPVVFVGASLFCFFNLTDPAQSQARILDPDHPIVLDENLAEDTPSTLMSRETFERHQEQKWFGKKQWQDYSTKWRNSFLDGLTKIYIALASGQI